MALLCESGQAPVADESHILAGNPRTINTHGVDFSYCLMDVLLDVDGHWVVIEVNGANGAGSVASGGDTPRVQHLLDTLEARALDGEVVAIAYQADTPCRPEIFARAAQVATEWGSRRGSSVSLVRPVTEHVPPGPCVLIGSTEEIASVLEVDDDGRLLWRGRLLVLLSNANVLPALVRRSIISTFDDIDLRVLHEGSLVAPVIYDKGAQQDLASGTGFRRLEWDSATTEADAIGMIRRMCIERSIIVKVNAGSGGTGVFPVARGAEVQEIRSSLSAALGKTAAKYGSTATAFPIRAFEFAPAWPVRYSNNKNHLWDLRLQIIARPGSVEVTPLSARICPAPFDGVLEPAAVVCNLTGTTDGADRVIGAEAFFRRLGVSGAQIAALAESAAAWMINAHAVD